MNSIGKIQFEEYGFKRFQIKPYTTTIKTEAQKYHDDEICEKIIAVFDTVAYSIIKIMKGSRL